MCRGPGPSESEDAGTEGGYVARVPSSRPRAAAAATSLAAALLSGACAAGPGLREDALLEGRDLLEQLSYVSQLDLLEETRADHARCSTAATLNAYLLLGGSFEAAADRFGVGRERTYGNMHRLQEALYHHANTDGEPGILGAARPRYEDGALVGWELHEGDEYHDVLAALGLRMERVYAQQEATPQDKRAAVEAWLAGPEPVVFIVGVDEDMRRERFAPMHERGNHYVLVTRQAGRFYALDPYRTPGRCGRVELRGRELTDNLFHTPNALFVLRR